MIISPRSEDLAAHLLRAKLFATEGFGIWNNWWYAGHNVPGYSVLFPPLGALLTPQVAGAIAIVPSAALFESMAHRRFGPDAWLGALWFGAATGTSLFTGRLTFAFGLLPALGTAFALQRRRTGMAVALAAITALASPVDAVFAALAGVAQAAGAYIQERRLAAALPGICVVIASALPVLALAVAFPEGGIEPFAFSALWPLILISAAFVPPASATRPRSAGRRGPLRDRLRPLFCGREPGGQQRDAARPADRRSARGAAVVAAAQVGAGRGGASTHLPPVAGTGPGHPHRRRQPGGDRVPTSSRSSPI